MVTKFSELSWDGDHVNSSCKEVRPVARYTVVLHAYVTVFENLSQSRQCSEHNRRSPARIVRF